MSKYTSNPFSQFNICMIVSFFVQEKSYLSPFQGLGEKLLDHALKLQPDSADAHLLKGWYYFSRDLSPNAVVEAKKALEIEPENARAWMGAGFFLAKTGNLEDALHAFQKTLELYPNYSKRTLIEAIIANLKENKPIDGFL